MSEGSRRPVCFSLHKYFKPSQPDPPPLAEAGETGESQLVAAQAVPAKPLSWLQKQLAKQAALEQAANQLVTSEKAGGPSGAEARETVDQRRQAHQG